jgi:hypothetical protein
VTKGFETESNFVQLGVKMPIRLLVPLLQAVRRACRSLTAWSDFASCNESGVEINIASFKT